MRRDRKRVGQVGPNTGSKAASHPAAFRCPRRAKPLEAQAQAPAAMSRSICAGGAAVRAPGVLGGDSARATGADLGADDKAVALDLQSSHCQLKASIEHHPVARAEGREQARRRSTHV